MGFDHTHQHEFVEPDELIFEDGAFIVTQSCTYAEITSAQHSEKHDETFYGYGRECEATRHTRLDASEIAVEQSNGEWRQVAASDENVMHEAHEGGNPTEQILVETLEETIADECCERATVVSEDTESVQIDHHYDWTDAGETAVSVEAYVEYADRTWRVTYDNRSITIDQ